jgi:hypothetical protein
MSGFLGGLSIKFDHGIRSKIITTIQSIQNPELMSQNISTRDTLALSVGIFFDFFFKMFNKIVKRIFCIQFE